MEDSIKHLSNPEPGLVSEILYDALNINSDNFKSLLNLGAIYLNNERLHKDKFISENSLLRVHTLPRRFNCDFPWKSLIVAETDFFLVLNKPGGIPSHPSIDNALENSLTQTSIARNIPLFVTHRLDTLTSGLIVYAKKTSFAKAFNIQLQERSIKKKYVALVESSEILPKKVTHFMDPESNAPKILSAEPQEGWQLCELEILQQRVVSAGISWIKINLLTGRTHQIRSQLSSLNAPIKGDSLYGAKTQFTKNAIALRSCEIEFNCGDERMKFNLNDEFSLPD